MLCPVDQNELQLADRQGVEIDYCPKCRGVWLDRGELDKISERLAGQTAGGPAYTESSYDERDDDHGGGQGRSPYGRRRRGFFGDLFDFD